MNIIAGLTEATTKIGTYDAAFDQLVRITAPKSFTKKELTKLSRDCELFLDRIRKSPEQIQALMSLGLAGNLQGTNDILNKLKLREEDFEKEGGGCIWLLVIIIIIICTKQAK
jgi:hypothetical protein